MLELKGKRVVVMGLGINAGGLGVTRFLVEQGADVLVTDLRSATVLRPTLDQLEGLPVRYVLGEHRDADFRSAEIVVRNPGVPRESRFLQIAREAGAAVEMEMTLFFRLCPGPILGITGTRGKTTTTLLTGALLRSQYPDTVVAGNLRVSALEQLPHITTSTPVVLELSSWQLEGLGEAGLSPSYSCVTNLSPDHLDRYPSMEAYAAAKREIVRHQGPEGLAVLNGSDPLVRRFALSTSAQVLWFWDGEPADDVQPSEQLVVVAGDDDVRVRFPGERATWRRIAAQADLQLPGRHNMLNVAAASALALAFGVRLDAIRATLPSFEGVADRLEPVRDLHGVRYVNDTTATTPTATAAALRAAARPVVLIAGGADKKLPFDDIGSVVAQHAKAVVWLAGSGTPRFQAALDKVDAVLDQCGPFHTLAEAVQEAQRLAQPGDWVLLSPGCASFGMFINEFDRGEQFRRVVQSLT